MIASARDHPRQAGTVWVLDLDEATPAIAPLVEAALRRLGPESAPELAVAMATTQAEVSKRFDAGRSCYTAWVEGQIAAYGWVSFDEEFIGELSLHLRLLPGEAYIWDCATLPAFRRRRLFSALLAFMLRELRAEPLCRVWIGADLDNVASQRGIDRAGFHRVANLVIRRLLALRQVQVQSLPGVPESLVAEARRAFLGNRHGVWLATLSAAKSPKPVS